MMSIRPVNRMPMTAALVMVISLAGFGFEGPSANATQSSATSLAGSYWAMVYNRNGFIVPAGPLSLKRDGDYVWGLHGDAGHGTWTESSDVVTLTGRGTQMAGIVFTAHVFGLNLGTRSHPGKVTGQGRKFGKWYALSCDDPSSPCL
jgi:hypothetical protein